MAKKGKCKGKSWRESRRRRRVRFAANSLIEVSAGFFGQEASSGKLLLISTTHNRKPSLQIMWNLLLDQSQKDNDVDGKPDQNSQRKRQSSATAQDSPPDSTAALLFGQNKVFSTSAATHSPQLTSTDAELRQNKFCVKTACFCFST